MADEYPSLVSSSLDCWVVREEGVPSLQTVLQNRDYTVVVSVFHDVHLLAEIQTNKTKQTTTTKNRGCMHFVLGSLLLKSSLDDTKFLTKHTINHVECLS